MNLALVTDPDSPLDELVKIINEQYHAAQDDALSALGHAIECGEALLTAQQLVPQYQWEKWLVSETPLSSGTAHRWMRLATFREHLAGIKSISAATQYLQEHNLTRQAKILGAKRKYSDDVREEAARLRSEGLNFQQVADALSMNRKTIVLWLDPEARRKNIELSKRWQRQQRKARTLMRSADTAQEAKLHGGDISVAYSLVRQTVSLLDHLLSEAPTKEHREALRGAIAHCHEAEGDIVRYIRRSRQED